MPSKAFIDLAQRNGQPLIAVGRSEEGPDHIRVNNALAAQTVVQVFFLLPAAWPASVS